jgi:hypothetical protein
MLVSMFKLLKNKKGDIIWQQLVAFILALLILAIMFYISVKSKGDMGSVTEKVSGLLG